MVPILKAAITTHRRASPNLPRTIPLTSTRRNTPINPTTVIYYNCGKNSYFALFYLELKDLGNIKEIEEGEAFNESGKDEP